ncbi:hypothetical protein [Streptomyces sp. NPDC058086]|uniref:hypothetical protein n=1 Tax=Streptomyces sp. NPDC058086 TaxID=3346334 RepID=UPI0036ED9547
MGFIEPYLPIGEYLLGTATQPGSIRELAQHMGCDPSNLTGVVQRPTTAHCIDEVFKQSA